MNTEYVVAILTTICTVLYLILHKYNTIINNEIIIVGFTVSTTLTFDLLWKYGYLLAAFKHIEKFVS